MTVAAGFVFDGGFLFCVDTKITGEIKTNESKLLHYRYADGACATTFAISSADIHFPRVACEACYDAVNKVDFSNASIESVRRVIQSALAKFYKEHIFPHPDRASGAVYIELLVGIWLKGETRIFISHETVLDPIDHYECIGTGAYLGKYLIQQYIKANEGERLDLNDCGLIASFAVESAIRYDENCGGEAEMIVVKDNGDVDSICDSVLFPGDALVRSMQGDLWKFLRELGHLRTEPEAEEAMRRYFGSVGKFRESSQWMFDLFEKRKGSKP
jgi:hypothetical protein